MTTTINWANHVDRANCTVLLAPFCSPLSDTAKRPDYRGLVAACYYLGMPEGLTVTARDFQQAHARGWIDHDSEITNAGRQLCAQLGLAVGHRDYPQDHVDYMVREYRRVLSVSVTK